MLEPAILDAKEIYHRYKISRRAIRGKVENDDFPAYQEVPGGKWLVSRYRADIWAKSVGHPIDDTEVENEVVEKPKRGRPKRR